MAITRIVTAKLAIIGDGAAVTYALNTSTGCYEVGDGTANAPGNTQLANAPAATVTAVSPLSGVTQIQKIAYTVVFAANVATLTFTSAPAAGLLDYVTLGLVVP